MWNHFDFWNGANNYISTSNRALYFMLTHYDIEQVGDMFFHAHGRTAPPETYQEHKTILRDFAIDWQTKASELNYSYGELADWTDFFTEYGKKYGLLSEFRENGIL